MLEKLLDLDKELFLKLNALHSSFFDFIMYWSSNKLVWVPLYILFAYILVKFYNKQSLPIILGLLIVVGLSDLISVHFFKNIFLRLRPCHDPSISDLVHLVKDHCGGQYSFYSSHASNHFAIATWMSIFLSKKIKYSAVFLFLWAVLIAYSRIYLGVHYPLDVIFGALMGFIIAFLCYYLYKQIKKKYQTIKPG